MPDTVKDLKNATKYIVEALDRLDKKDGKIDISKAQTYLAEEIRNIDNNREDTRADLHYEVLSDILDAVKEIGKKAKVINRPTDADIDEHGSIRGAFSALRTAGVSNTPEATANQTLQLMNGKIRSHNSPGRD